MDVSEFNHHIRNSKNASYELARLTSDQRADLVRSIGEFIKNSEEQILAANLEDLENLSNSLMRDRLLLNKARLSAMVNASAKIADLPDAVGATLDERTIDTKRKGSGALHLQKVTVPLGLIGIIYESRPNVTFDAAVLALKSGNGIVLRGGTDSYRSNQAIVDAIKLALKKHKVSEDAVWLMPTDRELVGHLFTAVGLIDVLIPRGSDELIKLVREEATVPTIETGAGVCHTYVTSTADLDKATRIALNAKLQRPTVCNALDTILVDKEITERFLPKLIDEFSKFDVSLFADELAYSVLKDKNYKSLHKATKSDYGKEYLGYGCSIKTVTSPNEALVHIRNYSSKHSEAIVSEDEDLCERFLVEVDAAVVYSNSSTRFTDGEMFGLGGELGISTQKLHARGPFSFEKLVTEKWLARGTGNVRT